MPTWRPYVRVGKGMGRARNRNPPFYSPTHALDDALPAYAILFQLNVSSHAAGNVVPLGQTLVSIDALPSDPVLSFGPSSLCHPSKPILGDPPGESLVSR
ncbi:hypothetical protein HYQ45_008944 [Verticillium longisporum]|uniref:Uncharacterized protein n=1 Tax=Verticillium longisporum TaxID=100787 RepID=A0A0G4M1I9_VERLO|nr:hypothetical protein HYQ45_008944 [Verticillium longisporum]CRK28139.1 hypothetical protein BN1708_004575 [Verticillium longisporum]